MRDSSSRVGALHCGLLTVTAMLALAAPLEAQSVSDLDADTSNIVKRDRTSTHYRQPDGSIQAVITIKPHNYQLPDGSWHPIAEVLQPGSEFAWENLSNGLTSRYPQALQDGVVVSGHALPALTMRPRAMVGFNDRGELQTSIESGAAFAQKLDERTVHYPGLFAGATDEYIVGPDMVKHNLVLHRAAINGFERTGRFGAQYVIDLPQGLTVVVAEGGRTLHLVDEAGNIAYGIGPVDAFDAQGEMVNGVLEGVLDGDQLVVTMKIDTAWALEESRAWPIRIDPTLVLQPDPTAGKDAYIRQNSATSNYGSDTTLGANYGSGSGALHVLVQFDVSSIPTTSTVNSAQFEYYNWGGNAGNFTFAVFQATSTWTESTVNWNSKPTMAASSSTSIISPTTTNVWRVFTGMGTLTQSWITTPASNFGFYIINQNLDYFYHYHHSSDYTTTPTLRPKFTVDYSSANPPTVSSVSPNPVSWLQTLTITGTNLTGATGVTIGGATAAITSNTATQVQVTVSDATPTGNQVVAVTTAGGTDNSQSVTVNSVAPTVSGATPNPVAWLQTLTINGNYLAGTTSVTIGGVSQTLGTKTTTSVQVTVSHLTPTGSQTIVVTTPGGSNNTASVTVNGAAPVITSVSPNPVNWLATLTINGSAMTGTSAVTIGGVTQTITSVTASSVQVTVSDTTPTGSQNVVLTNPYGNSNSMAVTVNGIAPTVTSVSPNPVTWLQTLTINGTSMSSVSAVTIGGVTQSITATSSTSVLVTVSDATPVGVQTIVVTNPAGSNNSASVTVNGVAPVVTSVSPDPVTWLQTLTITGNYLAGVSSVTIGGVAQTIGTKTTTSVQVTVADTTPTGVQTIVVTNPAGSNNSNSVTVNGSAPVVTSVAPDPVNWLQTLTINGNFLAGVTSVTIGGVTQTITSTSSTAVLVTVSDLTPVGSQGITVTSPLGANNTASVTVNGVAPTVTSVSPDPVAWLQTLTITGNFLAQTSAVTIGGVAATITGANTTQVTVTVSGTTPTGVQTVAVTTPAGTHNSSSVTVNGLPPVVTSVTPGSASPGQNITLTGNYLTAATVTVGGTATTIVSNTDTQIVLTLDALTPFGVQSINVTTGWGSDTSQVVNVVASIGISGGGGGGGGGGCAADSGRGGYWLLLGLLAIVPLAARLRRRA